MPPTAPVPGPDREPLAVAALAVGLVSLSTFFIGFTAFLLGFSAFVVGTSALLRLRNRPDRSGRAMAVIGIAAGVVSIPLAIILVAATTEPRSFLEPTVLPYARLNVGDCYRWPSRLAAQAVEAVWCGQDHDRQAVAAVELPTPAGIDHPGSADVVAFADEYCRAAFARFVDLPDEQASLVAVNHVPLAPIRGDGSRHIVCAVARRDGHRFTGSVTDNSANFLE